MFIPNWVIIPFVVFVMILLIVFVCMLCSVRCKINELITKIDNNLERVNSNSKLHNESTYTEIFFDYISDLCKCLVFGGFVFVMMYTLLVKYKLKDPWHDVIIIIFLILALSPLLFFYIDKHNKIKLLFKDSPLKIFSVIALHFIFSATFLGFNVAVIILDKANIVFNLFN